MLLVVLDDPGISTMSFGNGCFLNAAYSCWWRGLANSIDNAAVLA